MASEFQSPTRWKSRYWEQIDELLQSALQLEPDQRIAFLRQACADDDSLLREVKSLLSSYEQSEEFIEKPPLTLWAMAAAVSGQNDNALKTGTVIGRYRVVRVIGEGGMGVVYEALQENPHRIVALKFINHVLVNREVIHRFEQESEALGRLHHPGIAQIYEAGTTDTAYGPQPYFAMEFIRGGTLREYADNHQLNTASRLDIMAKVCDAVHHAHQRGLIHRDLKPENILVDETGQPKVLDFGVARITGGDAQATLLRTGIGQLVGTLPYMSPEQALADPMEMDTRSDVYSLGVILYELLSGRLPYVLGPGMHEALQAIREKDPARLSSISREYRGDIENVVAKALEKDKARRYSSASELAADIRRHLRDEPIMARPSSATYQLKKFARRHKAFVGGAAAVFVVLLAGVATSTSLAIRMHADRDRLQQALMETQEERDRANANEKTAITERTRAENEQAHAFEVEQKALAFGRDAMAQKERADAEAATATEVENFFSNHLLRMADPAQQSESNQVRLIRNNMLSARAAQILPEDFAAQLDPSGPNPNITVKELLDRAAKRIGNQFEKRPLVEARIRETIAETYFGLGVLQEARDQFEQAIELRRREQGRSHPQTLNSTIRLGSVLYASRLFTITEDRIRKVIEDERAGNGQDDPATRSAISLLLSVYTVVYNQEKVLGLPSAQALLKDVIDHDRRRFGEDNPTTRLAIPILLTLYDVYQPARYAEAETFLKQLLADQQRKLGDQDPATFFTISELADLYLRQPGKYGEGESTLRRLVEIQRQTLGDANPATIATAKKIASLSVRFQLTGAKSSLTRNYPDEEARLESVIARQRETLGPTHTETMRSMQYLAEVHAEEFAFYRLQGETELARQAAERGAEYYKRYLAVQRTAPGAEESQMTRLVMVGLASVQAVQGKYSEAEFLYREVISLQNRAANAQLSSNLGSFAFVGWLQYHRQEYADAEANLRQSLNGTVQNQQASWGRFNTESMLGAILAAQGKFEEAEPLLVRGYEGMLKLSPQNGTFFQPTMFTAESEPGERILKLYKDWEKPEKVAEWHKKTIGAPNFSLSPWSKYLQP